jgi:hypothetical protein
MEMSWFRRDIKPKVQGPDGKIKDLDVSKYETNEKFSEGAYATNVVEPVEKGLEETFEGAKDNPEEEPIQDPSKDETLKEIYNQQTSTDPNDSTIEEALLGNKVGLPEEKEVEDDYLKKLKGNKEV